MSNNNNSSGDSTSLQPVKSWYSALNTLQLPLNTNAVNSNRISPLINAKRISSSPSLQLQKGDVTSSPSISHIFKRLARTPTVKTSSNTSSSINNPSWLNLRKKGQQAGDEGVHIYMKSPHVVANGELAGTIVIHDDTLLVQDIKLSFIGIEAVNDPQHNNNYTTHYEFLNLQIFNMSSQEEIESHTTNVVTSQQQQQNIIAVPFLVTLSPQLSGTYIDKKGSIQYYLQSEIKSKDEKIITTKKSVTVYPNVSTLKSLKEATDLYLPIIENNKQVWKSLTLSVMMDLSLSRTVWMSGAPIYVTVKIHNSTIYTVCDMKLELLRKQNTCCLGSRKIIIPLTSSCETISQTSLSTLGWWQPLEPNAKDHITMSIEAPLNQVTVRNQKLIDVSFSIRMLISSPQSTDIVAEIPIMLVHPIAMDPPPLLTSKENMESNLISNRSSIKQRAPPKPLMESSASYTSSLTSILSTTRPASLSSYNQGSPMIRNQSVPNKKLEKMKKSISTWGSRITRKMSMNRINQQQGSKPPRPEISSPIISSHSASSCNESIASSLYLSPSSHHTRNQEISNIIRRSNTIHNHREEQRSVMKFGQIKGPKRFGQQPGCLGDAGLDIRNCFNVATATEVIQSYAAEKVEIPDDIPFYCSSSSDESEEDEEQKTPTSGCFDHYPPYLEPIQLSENNFKWKEGFIAPPEKCQLDMSMIDDEQEVDDDDHSSQQSKTSLKKEGKKNNTTTTKRILASSRHLINVQRKSAQVSKNGRSLLALPPSSV